MALDRLTKVDGGGISTTSDYRVGIITASKFVGPFDGTGGNFSGVVTATNGVFSGNISAVDGNFSGNVTIGGTLTYEDVTNIDSVGIITARDGLIVTGVSTFQDIDVDGHTNLDNVSVAGVSTFSDNLKIIDDKKIIVGNGQGGVNDLEIFHQSSNHYNYIKSPARGFIIQNAGNSATYISANYFNLTNANVSQTYATANGYGINLRYNNQQKLRTASSGIEVVGVTTTTGLAVTGVSTFTGAIDANGDLDVDGHTNLDNVSITGVTTTTGNLDVTDGRIFIAASSGPQLRINSSVGDSSSTRFILGLATITNGFINGAQSNDACITAPQEIKFGIGNNLKYRITNTNLIANTDLIPSANNIRSLGNSNYRWSDLYSVDANISGDLNVDGHTNLDNVSIAGVTTFASNINVTGNIFTTKYIYHTNDTDTYLDFGTNTINLSAGGNIGLTILDASVRVTDKLGINGAAPQVPLDVIANGSGYAINVRGRSSDNIGELRFTSNNYGALYGAITGGPTYLKFATGGTNRWSIDSSGHFVPNSPGSYNIGSTSLEIGDIYLGVNKKVFCGINQELQLYTDGTDGYLKETNGDLYLQSTADDVIIRAADNISIQAQGGEYCINGNGNGSVDLYYDGGTYTTPKLSTTATGITVDGEVKASQEYPLTKPVLDFNFAAEKKLDPRIQFTRESIATFVDKKGIVRYSSENQPRFDHHPTTGVSLGLLLEKQSINYQPYSVDMDAGAPNKNEVTVENNAAIAPDGTLSASKITGGTNQNTSQRLGWGTQGVASNSYTMWSIWVKSEETSCIVQIYSNTYTFGADHLNIELADGTTGGHSGEFGDSTFRYNIEKYPNKWWRLSWGGNGNAGGNSGGMYVAIVPSISSARGANTGSAHSKVWYAWGVQEEVGTQRKFATSYIPTNGASVTRAADRGTIDGDDFDDFFDRYQGAVVHETSNAIQSWTAGGSGWEFNNDNYQSNVITNISSGYAHNNYPGGYAVAHGESSDTGTNSMSQFGPNSATGNQAYNNGYYAGRTPNNSNVDYNRLYKTYTDGMSWDVTGSTNTLTAAVGGFSSTGTNTNVISYRNISKLEFGSDATDMDGSYQKFSGRIKRWMYYDKALTATQLENLTAQDPVPYL